MRSSDLKEYIVEQECIDTILEDLGCGYITNHGSYFTCSNPDGDNKSAIVTYINDNITVVNYTRNIAKNKTSTDIFDLVAYCKDCTFPEALKYVHNLLGLDFYEEKKEVCESLELLKMLKGMCTGTDDKDDYGQLKPISEDILSYYLPYGNKMFEDDGISLETQQDFEVMYDPQSNYVTIPIRDSVGTLCGVKGRYFGNPDELHPKYQYIEPCNKGRILYGHWYNKDYIKSSKTIIVVESEKGCMQLADMGYRNVVSTGGKTISKYQVELITRTGCTPIIAFDKDVEEEELNSISNMFMDGIPVYAIIDKNNILDEKESPIDNPQKFRHLIKHNVYKIKGGERND